jgi:tryptophan synthase alpha chain
MNKIDLLFSRKKANLLSIYFTAGFPQLNDTVPIIQSLFESGVDMIEVGIPFSDPMSDGEVIQRSSEKALKNGMNLNLLFHQLQEVENYRHIPILLMGYLNPILQFGIQDFLKAALRAGIDGVIIPDLPLEVYERELKSAFDEAGIKMIFLITPQTSTSRIRKIDQITQGFVYMVTSASTTGANRKFGEQHVEYFRSIRDMRLRNPVLAGFGINNRSAFDTACEYVQGAIVGSGFIDSISTSPLQPDNIVHYINSLRS